MQLVWILAGVTVFLGLVSGVCLRVRRNIRSGFHRTLAQATMSASYFPIVILFFSALFFTLFTLVIVLLEAYVKSQPH